VQQKVDDMLLQYEVAHRRKYPIAIVTDSTCDLPRELIDRYQIQIVPLHLLFGEREYLDKLTIDSEQFFDLADRSSGSEFPTSSQPSTGLFNRTFSYLSTYYDSIIAIHVAGGLSGTVSSSARAAEALGGKKKISVLDSRQVSASLGLVVLRAAEALDKLRVVDDAHEELGRCCQHLLARLGAAAAFDQPQLGIDLVGAVDVQRQRVWRGGRVEDADPGGAQGGRTGLRTGHGRRDQARPRRQLLDEELGGASGADAYRRAGLHVLERRVRRGAFHVVKRHHEALTRSR